MSSGVGFMEYDEDIISVLLGDNRLARKLKLTHPELARPLFHMWNIVRFRETEETKRRESLKRTIFHM